MRELFQKTSNLNNLIHLTKHATPLALFMDVLGGDLVASTTALHLIAWLPYATREDGYIYKSQQDWYNETRLAWHRLKPIYPKLCAIGFEIAVLPHATGRATHYRLNLRAFCKALASAFDLTPLKIFAAITSDPSLSSPKKGLKKPLTSTTNKTTDKTQTTTVAVAEAALPLSQNAEGNDAQLDDHPTTSAPASYARLKALGVSGRALMQFAALPITELERALAYVRGRNPRNIAGMLVECLRHRWHISQPLPPALPNFPPPIPPRPAETTEPTESERQDSWLEVEPTPAPVPTHERIWKQTVSQIAPTYRNGEASFLRRDPVAYDAGTNTYTLTISPYNRYGHLMRATLERTLSLVAGAFGLPAPALIIAEASYA